MPVWFLYNNFNLIVVNEALLQSLITLLWQFHPLMPFRLFVHIYRKPFLKGLCQLCTWSCLFRECRFLHEFKNVIALHLTQRRSAAIETASNKASCHFAKSGTSARDIDRYIADLEEVQTQKVYCRPLCVCCKKNESCCYRQAIDIEPQKVTFSTKFGTVIFTPRPVAGAVQSKTP